MEIKNKNRSEVNGSWHAEMHWPRGQPTITTLSLDNYVKQINLLQLVCNQVMFMLHRFYTGTVRVVNFSTYLNKSQSTQMPKLKVHLDNFSHT
jgi:hypothetical protein